MFVLPFLFLPIRAPQEPTGPETFENEAKPRQVVTQYGTYSFRFTVETFGAGGLAGHIKVTRCKGDLQQVFLDEELAAGSGVALLPNKKGFYVFSFREEGYRWQATGQRCVANC